MQPKYYPDMNAASRRKCRNEYVVEQSGNCYYCNEPLDKAPPSIVTELKVNWKLFPPNFLRYPVHLQHSHKTGMTEGAVHAYCNAVMWMYHGE